MKTLKKALSIILGVAMILSCVAGMQISASAEGNTLDLKVGTATVDNGVVTVPVEVKNNPGFQALTVTVAYDNTVLTLTGAAKNAKFAGDLGDSAVVGPTDANPFKMMWAYALSKENVTATGTIATLTFNVVEGATAESTDITLNVTEAWDVAKDDVVATATAGTVDLVKEPEVPECTHNWEPIAEEGSVISPTANSTGSVKVECTLCDEESTKTLLYNQLNAIASSSAACESEILMTFGALPERFAAKSDLTTVRVILEKEDHTADGLVKNYTLLTPEDAKVNTATSMQWEVGVRAIDMSEKITLTLICQTTDGDWYSGFVNSTSYAAYALKRVENATVDNKIKTVLLDAVNYGAASQLATGHYTENLANATFADYQDLYASDVNEVPDATNDRVLDSPSTAAVRIAGQNLLAESKTTIRFTLLKTNETDVNDVVVKVAYKDMSGNDKYFEFVNYDYAVANNMTDKLENGYYFTVNNNLLYLEFAELAAPEMSTKIDLDVEVSGEYVSGVEISIENLIRIMRDNTSTTDTQKACHNAMLRYGNSAYLAFAA